MKIAVLGATGMLGSMLVDYLSKHFQVVATVRSENTEIKIPNVEVRQLEVVNEVLSSDNKRLAKVIGDCQWVVNAIGAIPQRTDFPTDFELVNIGFAKELALVSMAEGCPVIQVATDCVYSGIGGCYTENSDFSPVDDYGKSKLLGEVGAPNMHHLRCSIIGKEPFGHYSLLGWFLSQPKGAVIMGYTNHLWNGITTLHFAKICKAIIESGGNMPRIQHIVPGDWTSKYALLKLFAKEFGREDITIKPVEREDIDRTLGTKRPEYNESIWQAAGYDHPPTIAQMVRELAEYMRGK